MAEAAKGNIGARSGKTCSETCNFDRNIVASAYNLTEDDISLHAKHGVLPTVLYLASGSMSF